jgi:hypothetical protein
VIIGLLGLFIGLAGGTATAATPAPGHAADTPASLDWPFSASGSEAPTCHRMAACVEPDPPTVLKFEHEMDGAAPTAPAELVRPDPRGLGAPSTPLAARFRVAAGNPCRAPPCA